MKNIFKEYIYIIYKQFMELIEIDFLFPIYAWVLLGKLLFYLNEL